MLELHPCSCIGIHDSIIQDSLAGGGNMDQKSSKMEEEEFSQELMPMSEVLRSVRVARAEEKMMKEKEEELKEKHLREKVDQADDQDIDDPDLFSTFWFTNISENLGVHSTLWTFYDRDGHGDGHGHGHGHGLGEGDVADTNN